jgi:phosphoglycolate phosphatase
MQNIDTVLFDLDGTLTDPAEGIMNSIRYALEQVAFPCPDEKLLRQHIGLPLHLAFKAIFGTGDDDKIDTAIDHYRNRYSKDGKGMAENKLYPAVPDVLAKLQNARKRLYVATSKPTVISRQITAHFKLDPFFTAVYGSELDGTRSDKGDLIMWLLNQEGLDPKQTVMIGDRKHDIVGAMKNGVRAIGALWGYGSAEELKNAGAAALAAKPDDLLAIVL